MLAVPPVSYAGTERVVGQLVDELVTRGHAVTLFASGDSTANCEIVPVVPQSLWSTEYRGDPAPYMDIAIARIWQQHARFDVIHSHVETAGFLFARHCPTPVVTTLHGRLDTNGSPDLIAEFTDIPLVAISESQRRFYPDNNWVATIHHGLQLDDSPFSSRPGDYLLLVGRAAPEKGMAEAIDVARRTGMKLKIIAKVYDVAEKELFEAVVQPAIDEGIVEYLGEMPPTSRDPVMAGARATLMLGGWPEPFGLVAIESMATGTPVIARRAGALTETVEHGVDGYLVDDVAEAELAVNMVGELDRTNIRQRALERFSVARMTDEYEEVYGRLISRQRRATASGEMLELVASAARGT